MIFKGRRSSEENAFLSRGFGYIFKTALTYFASVGIFYIPMNPVKGTKGGHIFTIFLQSWGLAGLSHLEDVLSHTAIDLASGCYDSPYPHPLSSPHPLFWSSPRKR